MTMYMPFWVQMLLLGPIWAGIVLIVTENLYRDGNLPKEARVTPAKFIVHMIWPISMGVILYFMIRGDR